jgi:hypothetical protein
MGKLGPELVSKLELMRGASLPGVARRACLATGIEALDSPLAGGIPCGAMTEIFGETGEGCWWLGLRMLARAGEKTCAMVEPAGTFFPPGAAFLGVDLGRLLVVREPNRKNALWALGRIAANRGVAATLAVIPRLTDTELRRLQLAAEDSGQALLLLRPTSELSRASWGALRLMVRAEPGPGRRLVVEVLRMRGGATPRPVLVELDHDTMAVRTSAVLPHRAVHAGRAASAG